MQGNININICVSPSEESSWKKDSNKFEGAAAGIGAEYRGVQASEGKTG